MGCTTIMESLESVATGAIALLVFVICLPRCVLRRANRWGRLEESESETCHLTATVHSRTEQQCTPSSYKAEEHIQVVVVNDSYLGPSLQPYPATKKTTTTTTTTTVHFQEPLLPISSHIQEQGISLTKTPSLPSSGGGMVPSNPGGEPGKVAAGGKGVLESPFQSNAVGEVGNGEMGTAGSGGGIGLELQRTRSAPLSSVEVEGAMVCSESEGVKAGGMKEEVVRLACGVAADIGQRSSMEDTYLAERDLGQIGGPGMPSVRALVGVFDGHNGAGAAEFAAKNFVGFLEGDGECMEDVIDRAFRRCETELLKRMEDGVAGTTALIAAVADNMLHIANLGDCRAVLCRDGRATQVTQDHKPGNEKERILAAGGFLDGEEYLNGEIGVSRAIGDFHLQAEGIKKLDGSGPLIAIPEIHSQELTPECEFIILGSDGVWDVMSNQRASDIVRKLLVDGAEPQKAAEEIVQAAKNQASRDNITAAVLALRSLPLPPRKIPARKFRDSRLKLASRSMLDINAAITQAQSEPGKCPLGI